MQIIFKRLYILVPPVVKGFNSSRKLLQAEIITVKLKAGLLLNASRRICPLTLINEVLRLSGSSIVASTVSP